MKRYQDQTENLPSFDVDLLGRRINCITVPSIITAIDNACAEQKKIVVTHYNVHGFNFSLQLPWFYEFMQSADIRHCDSLGILNAISYMEGRKLPIDYRASYTCLMPQLLEHCDRHHLSVFLLGSKPENLQRALQRLQIDYPNITISGHHGYFATDDPSENAAVIHQINLTKPQVLIVGMGMPVQENWVRLHQNRLNVNAILTGGAVIDRLAGAVPDCPKLLANTGWEWLYRLYLEPKRLATRYLLGNPAFMLQIALAKINYNATKVVNKQNAANSVSGEYADLSHLLVAASNGIDTTAIQ
jgi:N-acetylglucosaminyldiphosphoundecaprenol N-acetyl-beta-D-mannosaminyltransferase